MITAKERVLVIARAEKGWSQIELSQKAGLSPGIVSKIERGKNLSAKSAKKLADALGKSVTDLFDFSP